MSDALSPEDDARLQAEARAAGLERALARFPEDARNAFRAAQQLRAGLGPDLAPADEPWPPMRVDGSQ
jgi:hypothetical protein